MTERKVVLFVPLDSYAFQQQLASAKYLAAQSEFVPYFLLISEIDYQFIDQLSEAKILYSTLIPVPPTGERFGSNPRNQKSNHVGNSLFNELRGFLQLRRKHRVAKKLARSLTPVCAIVSQERPYQFLPVLKALKDLRIPTILMLAADSSPEQTAWARRGDHFRKSVLKTSISAILNRLVQLWLPSQIYKSPWGNAIFYPPSRILLLRMMGMLPNNPWYQGTNFVDYIVISGSDEAAIYAEAKVEPSKLLYFGTQELDILHENKLKDEQIRHELIAQYNLDSNKKILIVSLPRLREQALTSESVHWQAINDILDVLSRQNYNVMVSMHPNSDLSLYTWIENKYQVQILRKPLQDILVAADIFVASYSSTIRWAIGLGIPVINLDFWGFNWKLYENLTGYQTVTTLAEYDELVRNFISNPKDDGVKSRAATVNQSPDQDPDLSYSNELEKSGSGIIVDGKAKERLLRFIQSIDFSNQPSAFGDKLPANTGLSES